MHPDLLEDKLFFTKLPFFQEVDVLADIGCGPGAKIANAVSKLGKNVLAYDPNTRHPYARPLDWRYILENILVPLPEDLRREVGNALLFSSVLHEMFSESGHYAGFKPRDFWSDVRRTGARYVIVRDMAWNLRAGHPKSTVAQASAAMQAALTGMEAVAKATMQSAALLRSQGLPIRDDIRAIAAEGARTSRAMIDAEKAGDGETIFKEFTQVYLRAMFPPASFMKELTENYFAIDPMLFVVAAEEFGYQPIFHEYFAPTPVLDHLYQSPAYGLAMPRGSFTTHVKWVFQRA
jgi:hypothetical protein